MVKNLGGVKASQQAIIALAPLLDSAASVTSARGFPVAMESLCESCRYVREVISGKGSRFLLCELSKTNRRFEKYPPQPIVGCSGYARRDVPVETP